MKRKKNKKHPHSAMVEYYAKCPNQWVPVPELDPDGNSSRFKEELSAEELVVMRFVCRSVRGRGMLYFKFCVCL